MRLGSLFALLFLAGCVSLSGTDSSQLRSALQAHDFKTATQLIKPYDTGKSQALYAALSARLSDFQDQPDEAFSNYERAKRLHEQNSALSIGESVADVTLNKKFDQYVFPPYELNLLYFYQILSDLLRGDRDAALVDARQFSTYLLAHPKEVDRSPLSVALTNELSGEVFESLNMLDDAIISYRKALSLSSRAGLKTSGALELSYVSALSRANRLSEYPSSALSPQCLSFLKTHSPSLVIQSLGLMTRKIAVNHRVYARNRVIQVSVPMYPGALTPPSARSLKVLLPSILPENPCPEASFTLSVEQEARAQLAHEIPKILAQAAAREVVRDQVANKLTGDDNPLGAILASTMALIDEADLRSFFLLPQAVDVRVAFFDGPSQLYVYDWL